jgi:predicted AAA+ superfamily ATPase
LAELQAVKKAPINMEAMLFNGLYPAVYDRSLNPVIFYDNYIRTYIERDVRQLLNIRDISTFQRFVRMCAGCIGQLVNLSSLSSDCGITHNTAKAWLSVLEASYIIYLMPPNHRNFNKRLVKSPKLYFYDTGIAARLLGIQTPEQLALHPQRGGLFESWVVAELLKKRFNQALSANLFFWRDQSGNEVDVLIEHADKIDVVEIKSGQTIASDFFKGLHYWQALAKNKVGKAWLVYGGEQGQTRQHTHIISWKHIDELTKTINTNTIRVADAGGDQ